MLSGVWQEQKQKKTEVSREAGLILELWLPSKPYFRE